MDAATDFSFYVQPTREQLAVSVKQFMRPQLRLARLLGVLLIALDFLFFSLGERTMGLFVALLGVSLIAVVPPLTVRSVVGKMAGVIGRPTQYRVDDQGVRMTSDLTEVFYRWAAVDRLDETPGLLIARTGQSGFFAVPIADLPPETAAEVTAFVRAHVPA
ncbi:hypothetical protein GCM10010112_02500 [Actinoplanes lobatus]|uniref:YcxB-like protein domain-containing protein n=1 Tax=Actinoplanes lobatus TaxID=113568 RepID=A0A7W7MDX8_9ACTN|nr:YcxB family protein [Actinoplanes lobatus]MBB4746672.1 hypothetical protein [Actinoplanes lobatus]GGN53546.1 hypothetical protein GCM10010112_02500 [Actinoplanes lobatus]GIE38738.1 hypothetical protein Alo02nite_16360 [Actinoplanes lobatus]